MGVKDPLWIGRWTAKKLQAMVINDIWPEVLFFTLVATMVSLVSSKTSTSLGISNQMLTVLGTVLGLVVSFRTSSAYERYSEGRKLWGSIQLVSKSLAQLIWIHISVERELKVKDGGKPEEEEKARETLMLKAIIEKKTMINLIQAFSVSVKHMLRGEAGIYYEDLYPLICMLPRYAGHPPETTSQGEVLPLWELGGTDPDKGRKDANAAHFLHAPLIASPQPSSERPGQSNGNGIVEKIEVSDGSSDRKVWTQRSFKRKKTFDPERVLPDVESDIPLAPARNPPKPSIYDYLPMLMIFKPVVWLVRHGLAKITCREAPVEDQRDQGGRTLLGHKRRPMIVESSVPLEITLYLQSYVAWLIKNNYISPTLVGSFVNNILALQDALANLDRIKTTPIPFAYQAHLRVSMWIYLFLVPFQIYGAYKYLTIPATAFASFLLLGFLEIGQEIENPFNYDPNDLDLDHFCLVLQRELSEITVHPCDGPESFAFGPWNQPFAPADRRSAEKILAEKSHEYFGDAGLESIHSTLLRSWREVSDATIAHRKDMMEQ